MKAFHEIRKYPTSVKIWHKSYTNIQTRPHWHNEIELAYVKCGKAHYFVDDMEMLLSTGDLLICESKSIHYCKDCEQNTELEFLIFDPQLLSDKYYPRLKGFLHILDFNSCSDMLRKYWDEMILLIDEETAYKNTFFVDIISGEIKAFYYKLLREYLDYSKLTKENNSSSQQILSDFSDCLSYIDKHYNDGLTLSVISKKCGFSESHFSRIFKSYTGYTYVSYLNRVKVSNAAEMILSNQYRMSDISIACGFENIRNFNRVFLKYTGCTPSEYKNNPIPLNGLTRIFKTNENHSTDENKNSTLLK